MFFMKKLEIAINDLQALAKSRHKETKRIANILLTACGSLKKATKGLLAKIELLKVRDAARKEIAKTQSEKRQIKAAATTAAFMNDLQVSCGNQAPTADEAREMLKKSVCIITYKLVADSKSTGEKAGTVTSRFASRMPEVWHEYGQNPTGAKRLNGTIIYKDSSLETRSCSEKNLIWVYPLPDEIVQIFKKAPYLKQIKYCKLFVKTATAQRAKQTAFHNGQIKMIA